MRSPYRDLPDYCFWSKSVTNPAPGQIDPVTNSRIILKDEKISTMGSCFAQHLSRQISESGFNYYIAESKPEGMSNEEAAQKQYGAFSARYGNVYTARQALQLFDRAFGHFQPNEQVWRRGEVFVDALRPQIEPNGFANPELLLQSCEAHLGYTKDVFLHSDWLILTLGLTESWVSKADGTVYPVAPGVAGGNYDESKYSFQNFSIMEVLDDISTLVNKMKAVNPNLSIILTVSPVPLVATYEKRHVLCSTVASKSILRVACDQIEKTYENVYYFPSYEIITAAANGGKYFENDLRQVTNIGVNHVMRMFKKHFFPQPQENTFEIDRSNFSSLDTNSDILCDEELIEKALRASGL